MLKSIRCYRNTSILTIFADEDECQDRTHNCDANAQCNNTFGSFNCTCINGYSGDGVACYGMVDQ